MCSAINSLMILDDNPNFMIVGLNIRNPQIHDVYRLNVNSGELTVSTENPAILVHG